MRNVILVHGFWHGSWCWTPVTELLAARNIPSVAVDMAGHGLRSRSAGDTASSAAALLADQVARIGGGEPCVVVAHSMAGAVATAAAEFAPQLFSHLVYVAAFAPVSGLAAAEYLGTPESEGELVPRLLVADPAEVGALRIDPRDESRHAEIMETFYPDVDRDLADAAIDLLTPDGPLGIATERFPVTRDRYGAIPHSYVVCEKDMAVPAPLQRRFVREIDAVSATPTRVTELDSGHSPFFSVPSDLTSAIAVAWS